MKILLTILLFFTVYATAYSQDFKYPYKTVLDGDTVVVALMSQVDSLNITYASLDECNELYDSLYSAVDGFRLVIIKDKETIKKLEDNDKLNDEKFEEKDNIIEEYKNENNKLKKKNDRLKAVNKILTVSTIILAVIVAISIAL